MILTSSPETAAGTLRTAETPKGRVSVMTFIGDRDDPTATNPLAFVLELPPHFVIEPHFHGTNQYQLIVGGSGAIGKADLRSGVLHYADADKPYGPIVAGDEGLAIFTLRQTAYHGIHPMPASRHLRLKKDGRAFVAAADPARSTAGARCCVPDNGDGVAVYELTAEAGQVVPQPDLPHGGAYNVVLRGAVTIDGAALGPRSCIWVGAGERPTLEAGAEGAVLALMSFPRDFVLLPERGGLPPV